MNHWINSIQLSFSWTFHTAPISEDQKMDDMDIRGVTIIKMLSYQTFIVCWPHLDSR